MLTRETYWLIVIAITLFAFVKGRREERLAMVVIIVGTLATRIAGNLSLGFWDSVEIGVLVVDLAALLAFVAIALFTRRFWPLWVAGFQLASSSAHFLRFLHVGLPPWVYAIAERFWIYPILLVILIGTFRAHRYLPPLPGTAVANPKAA